jgi:heterodisulfide reductase subunit B
MRVGYFPGCSLHSTAKDYDRSTQAVCERLGIELVELSNWNCCGSTLVRSSDMFLSIALPCRNLAIAEADGLDIVAPCAVCYSRFKQAQFEVRNDVGLMNKVIRAIELDFRGGSNIYSPIDLIYEKVGLDAVRAALVRSLGGLKIAVYYGCLLVRPPKVTQLDDPENPVFLDKIMQAAGAETVDWSHKTECCGGSLSISRADIVERLVDEIMRSAQAEGADCIVTACPLCQTNLEIYQSDAKKRFDGTYDISIYYFTELLETAFGGENRSLGLLEKYCRCNGTLV